MAEIAVPVGEPNRELQSRLEYWLELLVALLLGLAAVATAWAAFQASQYDGQVLENFTQSNLSLSDANAYYSEGDQIYLNDQLLFLEYERALRDGNDEYAEYVRDSLMRDELIAAVDWWEQDENIDTYYSPFVDENPDYVIQSYEEADALYDERTAAFEAGKDAGKNGDTYNLVTVLLAASLFVLGIAGLFRATLTRIAAIGIGAALFISASIWMLTLPVAG